MNAQDLVIRPGTLEDSYATFLILEEALTNLLRQFGIPRETPWDAPERLARMWAFRQRLLEHLTHTAFQFWIAERDGKPIGYARSTLHDGVLELTEFFVTPGGQAAGVGRQLFERAFPPGDFKHRVIIATMALPAQARYLKAGVYPRFPTASFEKTPTPATVATDLTFEPMTSDHLAQVNATDEAVIGFTREADHVWLMANRQGWVYRRGGNPVGYGYTGRNNGPIALLDPADFPAVLAHVENQTLAAGHEITELEVPLHNQHAVAYLLARGFKMPDGFFAFFMTDAPFGKFDQYIVTSPPFFM